MRIGSVMGTVTLSKVVPELTGVRWLVVGPCDLKSVERYQAAGDLVPSGEDLVVADGVGGGRGQVVGFSEGGEAAMPYMPAKVPVDAYAGVLIDSLNG